MFFIHQNYMAWNRSRAKCICSKGCRNEQYMRQHDAYRSSEIIAHNNPCIKFWKLNECIFATKWMYFGNSMNVFEFGNPMNVFKFENSMNVFWKLNYCILETQWMHFENSINAFKFGSSSNVFKNSMNVFKFENSMNVFWNLKCLSLFNQQRF